MSLYICHTRWFIHAENYTDNMLIWRLVCCGNMVLGPLAYFQSMQSMQCHLVWIEELLGGSCKLIPIGVTDATAPIPQPNKETMVSPKCQTSRTKVWFFVNCIFFQMHSSRYPYIIEGILKPKVFESSFHFMWLIILCVYIYICRCVTCMLLIS